MKQDKCISMFEVVSATRAQSVSFSTPPAHSSFLGCMVYCFAFIVVIFKDLFSTYSITYKMESLHKIPHNSVFSCLVNLTVRMKPMFLLYSRSHLVEWPHSSQCQVQSNIALHKTDTNASICTNSPLWLFHKYLKH